jgi:flagellar hook-length control protein FliK
MINTEFMINPLAPQTSEASSSASVIDEISEEGSFLGCLLGALNGSEAVAVEEGVAAGKLQFVSEEFREILWTSMEERLGYLPQNATPKENTQSGSQPNLLAEILGALSDAGENEKQADLLTALIKENMNENQAVVRGGWNVDPEGNENGLPTSKVVKTAVNGDLIASEVTMDDSPKPTLGEGIPRGPSQGKAVVDEVFSAPKPTLGEGIARGSSQGKAVVDEALFPQTMKDLAQRLQGNHEKTPLAETLDRVLLSDSALPEGKGGMTQVMPAGEEMSHLQLTEPSALGEGATTPNRPVSAFLGDGLMAQVLESLNLRTWRAGQRELRIQLQPPELGRVDMKIGLDNHQVVLKIHVENPFVKDLIENNLAQLRQSLQDQGLRMDQCAVTVSDHDRPGFGANDENPTGSSGHASLVEGGEIEESPSERRYSAYLWGSDLVNVFV